MEYSHCQGSRIATEVPDRCGGHEQVQDTMERPEGVGGDSTDLKTLRRTNLI
jgi:hypothetical protein